VNLPPLKDADAHYTVYVKQFADFKHGERTVTFTDPAYWAQRGHRSQFHIDLSKQNANDLLHMESQVTGDPRYQTVVNDFRSFGPDEFRKNVAQAQARARISKCVPAPSKSG